MLRIGDVGASRRCLALLVHLRVLWVCERPPVGQGVVPLEGVRPRFTGARAGPPPSRGQASAIHPTHKNPTRRAAWGPGL